MAIGTASQTEVGPAERSALEDALANLRPRRDHPVVGGLIGKLEGALGGADQDDDDRVEKALLDIRAASSQLRKSENSSPALLERVQKSERDLEDVYLRKSSVGYQNAARNREAGIRY